MSSTTGENASRHDASRASSEHLHDVGADRGSSARPQDGTADATDEGDHRESRTATHAATPPSITRPSLLAISSALGKASSTSSTSVTTVPRVQRSASNLSVKTGRSSPSSKSNKGKHRDVAEASAKSMVATSLPASPTSGRRAIHALPQMARSLVNDGNGNDDTAKDTTASASHLSFTGDASSAASASSSSSHITVNRDQPRALLGFANPDDVDKYPVQDEEVVSWPLHSDGQDPRELLREQLRRSESARLHSFRSRTRTDSYKSVKSASSASRSIADLQEQESLLPVGRGEAIVGSRLDTSAADSEPSSKLRRRRYFVLTSAGKPVFASQPNWRKRRKQQDESINSDGKGGSNTAYANDEIEQDDADEILTSLVGVIQAVISLYAVENDMIRYIDAGKLKIAFYLKAPMYLVAVSDLREPESLLRTHLEYLHLAILSITTQSSITNIFKQRSNFDLRRLLSGTENILNGLLDSLQETYSGGDCVFEAVSGALRVVPFLARTQSSTQDGQMAAENNNVQGLRDECTKALRPPKKYDGILYALLVSHSSLVTLLRPKDHSIHPADLHILLSTIRSTYALRTPNSESWIPICLPRFNPRGFLHAFISYIDGGQVVDQIDSQEDTAGTEDLGLGIVLLTTDKEGFFDMKEWKDHILEKLLQISTGLSTSVVSAHRDSLYTRIHSAVVPIIQSNTAATADKLPEALKIREISNSHHYPNIPPIRHFWYKSKTHVQIFTPTFPSHASVRSDLGTSQATIAQYLHIREALHNSANRTRGDGSARLVYIVGEAESILGLSTTSYELYACLPPLVPKKIATEAAHALARWIRKNEAVVFLTSSASF